MRIPYFSILAFPLFAIAICAATSGGRAQEDRAQEDLRRITLKSGESTELRQYLFVQNCESIMIGTPALDVLDGPEELNISLKEGMVRPRGQNCTKPVPGGTVVATARDVKEPKEAKLTIRLRFKTKVGERQGASVYIVSLTP